MWGRKTEPKSKAEEEFFGTSLEENNLQNEKKKKAWEEKQKAWLEKVQDDEEVGRFCDRNKWATDMIIAADAKGWRESFEAWSRVNEASNNEVKVKKEISQMFEKRTGEDLAGVEVEIPEEAFKKIDSQVEALSATSRGEKLKEILSEFDESKKVEEEIKKINRELDRFLPLGEEEMEERLEILENLVNQPGFFDVWSFGFRFWKSKEQKKAQQDVYGKFGKQNKTEILKMLEAGRRNKLYTDKLKEQLTETKEKHEEMLLGLSGFRILTREAFREVNVALNQTMKENMTAAEEPKAVEMVAPVVKAEAEAPVDPILKEKIKKIGTGKFSNDDIVNEFLIFKEKPGQPKVSIDWKKAKPTLVGQVEAFKEISQSDKFLAVAGKIKKDYENALNKINLTPDDFGRSDVWINLDLSEKYYLYQQKQKNKVLGKHDNPLEDEEAANDVVNAGVGKLFYRKLKEDRGMIARIKKGQPRWETIRVLLSNMNDSNATLNDYTRLGSYLRLNLGEEETVVYGRTKKAAAVEKPAASTITAPVRDAAEALRIWKLMSERSKRKGGEYLKLNTNLNEILAAIDLDVKLRFEEEIKKVGSGSVQSATNEDFRQLVENVGKNKEGEQQATKTLVKLLEKQARDPKIGINAKRKLSGVLRFLKERK